MLLETKFGMGVNIAPNGRHLSVITGQVVDQSVHGEPPAVAAPIMAGPATGGKRHRPS